MEDVAHLSRCGLAERVMWRFVTGQFPLTTTAMSGLMALAVLLSGCAEPRQQTEDEGSLDVSALMGPVGDEGFERALEPRGFRFPGDHGPHDGFRTEWWYYTGNLTSSSGRRFGFQLTFFRNALASRPPERASSWATSIVHMGHFAVTDVDGGRFFAFERFARESLGLAGARAEPFRVWIGDWESTRGESGAHGEAAAADREADRAASDRLLPRTVVAADDAAALPMRIRAEQDGVGLTLELVPLKPLVLQGDRGLSQKGQEPGNASYYYSFTRLGALGTVSVDAVEHAVEGLAWMDREWSTSALSAGQVGWDWFALQLDDGSELMLYRLRRADGSSDPLSAGTFVRPRATNSALADDCETVSDSNRSLECDAKVSLGVDDFELEQTDSWKSPRGGDYPAGWVVRVESLDLELSVTPLVADQELDVTVRYWEGAVSVTGTRSERPVSGRGYVELTGYSD
jgi:predicted secreted hydrolase